ncbi:PAS domain-containing sensor histidine kinase [Halobaculum sp. WSA2]|uniref:histidine kinase n=1 Tax=Halobaculum saliterrae TaxID=2073113 RepID=A0A6B0SV15_9EURY|nr:PAS domain-containing sensor histidine kinase [Halobaculum saliterrae]
MVTAGFDALPVEIAVISADGTIVLVNDAWRRFADENHGSHPDYWVGENYLEIGEQAFSDPYASDSIEGLRAILGGVDEPLRVDYPCHSPDDHRWFALEAAAFTLDGDRYALVVHHDITAQKLAEQRSAAREKQLETLVGVLSHDIRNPLNVIEGYADLLAAEIEGDERIDAIRRAALRISEIAEATLAFTESGALSTVEPVRVSDLARDAWEMVATADATLTVERTATIHGDRSLLLQLLENLFRNAVTHAGPDPAVRVGSLPDGFYVEDDGPGVPEDLRDRAVEADFSTAGTGGLGLAIVQAVVQAHGGTLTITDADGGGARFEISGVDVAPERATPE